MEAEIAKLLNHTACAGQNKNFFTLLLWQYFILKGRFQSVDHKFPEPGHSFLESDRDFAHVEKVVRQQQNIYSVEEYKNIMLTNMCKETCK